MDRFKNLYEVRKTINFEFKPSLSTRKRVLDSKQRELSSLIDSENIKINIQDLFNNQDQEAVSRTRNYFVKIQKDFERVFNIYSMIIDKISQKKAYENFRIYIDTERIKLLGKDFRDCYQEVKRARTKKGRGWDYYFKFNYKTQKPEFRTVKFGDFLTVHHLFAFGYDKKDKKGKFEKIFLEKIDLLRRKYEFLKIELKDFLDVKNQSEKFITKPEVLDRLKSLAYCLHDIGLVMNIFCDEGKNGSEGCGKFLNDFKDFKSLYENKKIENIYKEVIRQANIISNPKTFHYKFTLNFKAKNPNIQFSGNDTFLSEQKLQIKLKEEMNKLESNKKNKSDCQGYISKFDNLAPKDCMDAQWQVVQNKQGLPQNFQKAKNKYEECKKNKEELNNEIAFMQNERNNYSVLNQIKAALQNSKNTHFGVIIEKDDKYFLALESKIDNEKLKADDKYALKKLENKDLSCKILRYESLTWKAVEKLCLLPTSSLNGKDDKMIDYWSKFCKTEIILEKKNENDVRDILDTEKIKNYLGKIASQNHLSKFFNKEEFEKCKNLDEIKSYFNDFCFTNEWVDADWDELKTLDEDGKIDLYQIYNKDFELDECFATSKKDEEKIEKINKVKKKLGVSFIPKQKNNERGRDLFTVYWNSCFDDFDFYKYRLQPEGRIYIRNINPIHKSPRYQEEKVLGDFGIVFNPTTKEVNQSLKDGKIRIENFNNYFKDNYQNGDEAYVIGLDRGENSLVSYALVRFKKKVLEQKDVKVRFDDSVNQDEWMLNEIIEAKDLSAVKVFNQKGNWGKSIFVEQKEDFYFIEKNGEYYDAEKNKQLAENKKNELKKQYPDYKNGEERVIVVPIRHKPDDKKEMKKSGAYAVKILSWEEEDGSVYNYRVAQEKLKERRLEQIENNKDFELFETEKFKNGYVSALSGFIAKKVKEHHAFISLENLNLSGGKEGNFNKTFNTSVYQVIENRLMTKLGYLVLKNDSEKHIQVVPKIRRIDELKKDVVLENEKNKDYQLGFVQITDETNTSKICPNCGYSKNRYKFSEIKNGKLNLELKMDKFQNLDFGLDGGKKKEFKIETNTMAYKYSNDGVKTEELQLADTDFCKTLCDPRQNKTKSNDFIRCVHCGFDSRFPKNNHEKLQKINSGDFLAAYNIAKRGLEFITTKYNPTSKS